MGLCVHFPFSAQHTFDTLTGPILATNLEDPKMNDTISFVKGLAVSVTSKSGQSYKTNKKQTRKNSGREKGEENQKEQDG